ncbi:MAG: amidohydrolase [Desulfobacteraceae bacterium]|nr:amidohydrolase [Desulfobacteraceae bacterium]
MKAIKAALVVQNCIAGNFEHNLKSTCKFISEASQNNAKIIVFPEMNLTGYVSSSGIISISKPINSDITQIFSTMAKDLGITILVGIAEKKQNNEICASHLIFFPNGTFDVYRKIHTAPFEKKYFTAGNTISVFKSHGLNFGVQLCYDAHFPELTLAQALKKADIIFIPHASPRGSSHGKYDSWIRHLRARAFDNGLYIAACNQIGDNSKGLSFPGVSLLIGPDGNVISKSIDNSEGIHIITIEKTILDQVRSHKMRYFLPNRRNDLFKF